MFQMSLSSMMDETEMNASNDYSETLSNAAQDELTRGMTGLHIGREKTYNDLDLGLNSEIHPSIWSFVKLLSEKLDNASIPNLFGSHNKPTSKLLVKMLECHKLRSTFDFEVAIARKWKLHHDLVGYSDNAMTGMNGLRWNFRVLDLAAGKGTSLDTMLALKK